MLEREGVEGGKTVRVEGGMGRRGGEVGGKTVRVEGDEGLMFMVGVS